MLKKPRMTSFLLFLCIACLTDATENHEHYTFETTMVEMDDGVSLSTDIYLPKSDGPFPVTLVRTPYNKSHPMAGDLAKLFTAQGIALVTQDCRGRLASEGTFYAFKDDRRDGLDTLKWLRAQPWHNGKTGGALGSYNSYTQLAIADELDVVLDVISCANMYELIYPGELYSLETVHNWAFNMDAKESNGVDPQTTQESYWTLPLEEATTQAYGRKGRFVDDWLKHEKYDAYWKAQDHKTISQATTFSFAGWYDIFLMGQLADFEALNPEVKAKSRLVIGPWAHGQHEIKNDFSGQATIGKLEQFSLQLLAETLLGNDPSGLFTDPLHDAIYNLFIMERNEYFPADA